MESFLWHSRFVCDEFRRISIKQARDDHYVHWMAIHTITDAHPAWRVI